ncbi:MAG: M23 family metallopeptidase [Calditrichaeota bacterium]|nr:M23 family metallopeptidase [Calditrichota bacterium]
MTKKGKQPKQVLSILVIPDDYSDPKNFRIKMRTLHILYVVAVLLTIHIVVGFVFYFKYYHTKHLKDKLTIENYNLAEENKQVKKLYDEVQGMKQFFSKFRSALGVDKKFDVSEKGNEKLLADIQSSWNQFPMAFGGEGPGNKDMRMQESDLDFFLTRSESHYHQFADRVPTYLPVEGFLTTDFRRNDWYRPDHNGIDIATSRGTEVRASADGIVLFANWTDDLGNLIIINHLNGFQTVYGHNQVLLKKEGNYVKKGEAIALLGSSGRSTAPHLHFEIWKDGFPVDPKKYLLAFQSKDIE